MIWTRSFKDRQRAASKAGYRAPSMACRSTNEIRSPDWPRRQACQPSTAFGATSMSGPSLNRRTQSFLIDPEHAAGIAEQFFQQRDKQHAGELWAPGPAENFSRPASLLAQTQAFERNVVCFPH